MKGSKSKQPVVPPGERDSLAVGASPAVPVTGYLRDVARGSLYRVGPGAAVGRDLSCVVLVREPDVASVQAVFEESVEGRLLLVPREGDIMINGSPVSVAHVLHDGDTFAVGECSFAYHSQVPDGTVADADLTVPPSPQAPPPQAASPQVARPGPHERSGLEAALANTAERMRYIRQRLNDEAGRRPRETAVAIVAVTVLAVFLAVVR